MNSTEILTVRILEDELDFLDLESRCPDTVVKSIVSNYIKSRIQEIHDGDLIPER